VSAPRLAQGLQSRLLWWLLPALALLVAVNSVSAYRTAHKAVTRPTTGRCTGRARVADRVELRDGRVAVEVPYIALDFFSRTFAVTSSIASEAFDGAAVSGYDDLPHVPSGLPRSEDYFALASFYSRRVSRRARAHRSRCTSPSSTTASGAWPSSRWPKPSCRGSAHEKAHGGHVASQLLLVALARW